MGISALVSVGIIGGIDFLTGRDLVVSALYLFPICWVTWRIGRQTGLALALVSAGAWLAGDYLSGYAYAHPAIPIWNALMLLGMFLPAVYLLSAFQRAHVHLEETVATRTAALQTEIKERKRAESAKIQAERLAMVGTMAAQVAHEVRNPLGAIVLTLDLLEDDLEKISASTTYPLKEGAELVKDLREEVHRIDRVIFDYLFLARPRNANLESLDLNNLIRRKFAFMRNVFAEPGVALEVDLEERPIFIRADGDQLWQAILNITRNSLEAMPDGGTLTVETFREGHSAVVRLSDTGCGMTPEQKQQLFVPFVTSKANGTGLGLALVNQIVTEHKGRVECSTSLGDGTSFTITIPLDLEPARKEASKQQQAVPV